MKLRSMIVSVLVAFAVGFILGLAIPWPFLAKSHREDPFVRTIAVHDTVYVDRPVVVVDKMAARRLARQLYAQDVQCDVATNYIEMSFGKERAKLIMDNAFKAGLQRAEQDTSWVRWTW